MARDPKIEKPVSARWARFCGWWLRKKGWKSLTGPIPEKKAVAIGAPNTSARDFLICYLFYTQYGKRLHLLIKKEFFFWPLGPILRACGAVPVDRSSPGAVVKSVIRILEERDEFIFDISPEGSRKAVKKWKTGYHFIAREAGVPVWLTYFDWKKKILAVGERFELTDDARADTDRMQAYYASLNLTARHPDQFTP